MPQILKHSHISTTHVTFGPWLAVSSAPVMDILRMGVESIDSFDAKSYEYRIECQEIRFDIESATARSIRCESNGAKHSIENRSIRSNECGGSLKPARGSI
jgi:hypothetical protein